MGISNQILLITAKGYPDHSTKNFIKELLNVIQFDLPCIYLGDADPFGCDIYF